MKYLKIALSLMLVLALVANVSFAAGSNAAGRIRVPDRAIDQPLKMVKHTIQQKHIQAPVNEPVEKGVTERFQAQSNKAPVIQKMKSIPPEVSGGLGGTFTVGVNIANKYHTIADIANVLNIAGIKAGGVIFELEDAAYTEGGVVIGGSFNASAAAPITIRPKAGNAACAITLTDVPANGGGLVLDTALYLTIDGRAGGVGASVLTIQLSATPVGANAMDAPVRIINSQNTTVEYCIIPGNSAGHSWLNGNASVFITATPGYFNSYVTIDHCEVYGGHYGIYSKGNFVLDYGSYGVQDDHINVTNCNVHNIEEDGIQIEQCTYSQISGNNVNHIAITSAYGAAPNLLLDGSLDHIAPTTGGAYLACFPQIFRPAGITYWGDEAVIENNAIDDIVNGRTSGATGSAQSFGIRMFGFGNNDPGPYFGGGFSLAGLTSNNQAIQNTITRVFSDAGQANGQRWHEVGIFIAFGRSDKVYNNTVYFSGTELGLTHPGSACGLEVDGAYTTEGDVTYAGYPFWLNGAVSNFASERTNATDNIFAFDRTDATTDNACIVGQDALAPALGGYVVDIRPPTDYNVLFLGNGVTGNVGVSGSRGGYADLASWQGYDVSYPPSNDGHSQVDDPALVSETVVSIDPARPSTADGSGTMGALTPATDFDGTPRPLGPTPNIGAYEGHGSGAPLDLKMAAVTNPTSAGVPAGLDLGAPGITIHVLNLTSTAAVAAPFTVHITGPDPTRDYSGMVSAPGLGSGDAAATIGPLPWHPTLPGTYTFTCAVNLPGDVNIANDTLVVEIPVASQVSPVGYCEDFETSDFNAGNNYGGWSWNGDFAIGSTSGGNTKLGGAHGGDQCLVTVPGAEKYSPPGGPGPDISDSKNSFIVSPYFDFSTVSGAILSFYHSLSTEPHWDRSTMEYSLDTGKTWNALGVLNDANGINWYSTSVYANAGPANYPCFDSTYAKTPGQNYPGFKPYRLGIDVPCWTSNGNCSGADLPTGPNGYIYVQYDLSKAVPAIFGTQYVRFRYHAYTDSGSHGDGWAFDDFCITATAPPQTPALYSGTVYLDTDGDGAMDHGELGIPGATVNFTYFGVTESTKVADGNGNFTFTMTLPGNYNVNSNVAGYFTTQTPSEYNYTSNGIAVTLKNVGRYQGTISGEAYADNNDNGALNVGEAGQGGYLIEVHRDSCTGALLNSIGTTNGTGRYTVAAPPGTFYVVQNAGVNPKPGRSTTPCTIVTVSGNSGTVGTAIRDTVNFGNFIYADLKCAAIIDVNGDGIRQQGEQSGLPTGLQAATARLILSKTSVPGTVIDSTIGNGLAKWYDAYIDTGAYNLALVVDTVPGGWSHHGWIHTNASSFPYNVTVGSQIDTLAFLFYHYAQMSGTVFVDVNGNAVYDSAGHAEVGQAGWVIHVSGNGSQNDTTDVNGQWTATNLGTGAHTATITGKVGGSPGWVYTLNPPGGYGPFTFNSNNIASASPSNDWGIFQTYTISGTVYRDRNFDAVKDAGEEDMSATLHLTVGGVGPVDYPETGAFTIGPIGPGACVLTQGPTALFVQTDPAGPNHNWNGTSGTNLSNLNFGLFKGVDSLKYSTFTTADFVAGFTVKAAKAWTAKAPTTPNIQNLVASAFTKGAGAIYVGLSGQMNRNAKEKAYLLPAKASDIFATYVSKISGINTPHTVGTAQGFGLDNKGNVMLKRQKNVPPKTQNNELAAHLEALRVNMVVNDPGHTPVYVANGGPLGALIITTGTYANKTISQFAIKADSLMTNWEFVPGATYAELWSMSNQINNAFRVPHATASDPFVLAPWQTIVTPAIAVKPVATVYAAAASFLKAPVGPAPATPIMNEKDIPVPTSYAMYQNYPNPFNPTTTLRFDLPQASTVTLTVYNMLGQQVTTLLNHEDMSEGQQEVTFNANNYASGVYFYRIVAQGQETGKTFTQVMKMALIK
ncbi:MAG: SdrD B-like domain-containing protein [Bacteroidota bacterium]